MNLLPPPSPEVTNWTISRLQEMFSGTSDSNPPAIPYAWQFVKSVLPRLLLEEGEGEPWTPEWYELFHPDNPSIKTSSTPPSPLTTSTSTPTSTSTFHGGPGGYYSIQQAFQQKMKEKHNNFPLDPSSPLVEFDENYGFEE